jgi:hypothetical protein
MTPLFKKMNLKDQKGIVVLNAPASFEPELAALDDVAVQRKVPKLLNFALAFVTQQKDLDAISAKLTHAAEGDAILWIAYPKGTSKNYTCDFNRDSGWTVLGGAGWEPVRMIAIDADWSALRFRRVENVKTMTRSEGLAISKAGKARALNLGEEIG